MREPYTSATTPPERRHGIGGERCPLRLREPPMQSTTLANISAVDRDESAMAGPLTSSQQPEASLVFRATSV